MTANPDDPFEADGVLNPASAWGDDGELYLFPRLVAAGNFSRIGKARVVLVDGVPVDVERQGLALVPERGWERGSQHGGVEDPRLVWVPSLEIFLMTYVAFGPIGPRPAIAVSRDLATWRRLGPLRFEYDDELETDLNLFPNKDVVFFPDVVPDPEGRPSYALLHRPMWDFAFVRPNEIPPLPSGLTDSRASIWISYVSATEVEADLSALARPGSHRLVAAPEFAWESLKIGAGPPPIPVDEGWLLVYHGVSGVLEGGGFTPQRNVHYAAGAMILSATNPAQVIARTNEPILVPETSDEIDGVVPNVVFPTASELIGGERYVFYGMADTKIGVARLDRTNAADNSIEHNGTGGDRSEQTA